MKNEDGQAVFYWYGNIPTVVILPCKTRAMLITDGERSKDLENFINDILKKRKTKWRLENWKLCTNPDSPLVEFQDGIVIYI